MRTSLLKTSLVRFGFAAAAMVAAGTAAAAPIENWEYTVSSVFTGATFTASGPGTGCPTTSATSISWGICPEGPPGEGRSGIGIGASPTSGTITTNGAVSAANTYTHSNNGISGSAATLKSATITATLGLRVAGSGSAYTNYSADYTILFAETPNATPCAAASPVDKPCNDIWALAGSLNKTFTIGADQYFFSFFAAPELLPLGASACAAAGAPLNCSGFTTIEGQNNLVNFVMRITSERIEIPGEVPEPASIALLGAGLLGLAGVRRRQQKNKA